VIPGSEAWSLTSRRSLQLIWQGVPLGDTNDLQGCYFVHHCLRRLAAWADKEMRSWWEQVLAAKMAQR
jgi:hypothetical protein